MLAFRVRSFSITQVVTQITPLFTSLSSYCSTDPSTPYTRTSDSIYIRTLTVGKKNNSYNKIAALGVRVTSWISWHGISINLNPDIRKYKNIIPCGISDGGITSIRNLDQNITLEQLDQSLIKNFNIVFGEDDFFNLSY